MHLCEVECHLKMMYRTYRNRERAVKICLASFQLKDLGQITTELVLSFMITLTTLILQNNYKDWMA